jgi:RHS repeat-associated protein
MLYLHRDYQGSILAITNDAGAVLEKRLFDAWGAIIQVQDGAGNILNGLTILDRGYTGHEHLQSVGIINMNGRIYDPKLHRFLQPDNYVQDPSNTQNYNRYGYVLNNPLRYSDPTGEFTWSDLVAAAAIVAGVVVVIASGGTLTPVAQYLIGAGVAHFLGTFASYMGNKAAGWDAASNYIGIQSPTINIKTGWGDSKNDKNGITQSEPVVKPKTVEEVKDDKGNAGNNWATATLGFIGTDIAIPEPTDAAWPKWVGYGIAGTAAATYLYSGDYITKMQREIDRISERAAGPQGFVYELTATRNGPYRDYNTGGYIDLKIGDVWKYGITTTGSRYPDAKVNLVRDGLQMTPLHPGNQMQILIYEKYYIYGHFFMTGSRPPGNGRFK